jgi:hypothetical protein
MPAVPYSPVPDVAISQQGISPISVPTPIAAFGGTIAEAIGTAGRTMERAGDEIMQRAVALQQLQNENEAREADAEFTIAAGELKAKYHSTVGRMAVEANPQYNDDVRNLQTSFRDRLSNPASRRLFDRESRGAAARAIFGGATHAASQNREQVKKTNAAVISAVEVDVYNDPSPTAMQVGLQKARAAVQQNSDVSDYGPEVTEQVQRDVASRIISQRIAGLARNNPAEAQRVYDEFRDQIRPQDDPRVQATIENNLFKIEGERIAAAIVGALPEEGQPGMSRREAVEEAARRAKEIKDDPRFIEHVKVAVGTAVSRRDAVIRDDRMQYDFTVGAAMTGAFGKIPTSPDELIALSPEMQQAWDRLHPTQRTKWMNRFDQNAKKEYGWKPDGSNFRRFQEIKGLAETDTNEFLGLDIAAEQMPFSARQQLIKLQQDKLKAPGANPAVVSAARQLRELMISARVMPSDSKERNAQFMGALQDALLSHQAADRRKPNPDEIQQIGRNLLKEIQPPNPAAPRGFIEALTAPWSFGGPSRTPVYRIEPPAAVMEGWRKLPRFSNTAPTQAQVDDFRRQFRRREYQRLFGGSASSSGAEE